MTGGRPGRGRPGRAIVERPGRAVVSALVLLVAWTPAGRAQGTTLTFDAGASHSIPPGGSSASAASYVQIGVRLQARFAAAGFGYLAAAGGLAVDDDGADWVSALAGAGTSVPLGGPFHLDFAASVEAFTVGDPFPFRAVLGEAEPALRLALGRGSLRLAAWGGAGRSEADVVDEFTFRSRRGLVLVSRGTTLTGDLWSAGGRAEYRHVAGALEPWARLEAYDAPQGSYAGGRLGVRFTSAAVDWDVELGAWDTPDGGEVALTARLGFAAGRSARVRLEGGRYGPDPLLDTRAAGNGSLVLSWTPGRWPPASGGGATHRISDGDPALVTFMIEAPGARSVTLVGEFADWEEIPMQPEDGSWSVRVPVRAGAYRYGFRVDGAWHVPADAPGRTEDEWGVAQATLVVARP